MIATILAPDVDAPRSGTLGISYPRPATRLGAYSTLDPRDPAHNGRPATGPHSCRECGRDALGGEELCEACAFEEHRAERRGLGEKLFDCERDLRAEDC